MMSPGLYIPLIHVLIASPVLIYAGICIKTGKKCQMFAQVLIGLGIAVGLYHLYNLVVRMGLIEGYTRQGGYLGRPIEPFVPFSFPYHKETDRYYSYHDNEHTRNCNCKHNDGHTGCHATETCDKESFINNNNNNNTIESFDTVSPVGDSVVRSGHM